MFEKISNKLHMMDRLTRFVMGLVFIGCALAASAAQSCEKPGFSMTRERLTVVQELFKNYKPSHVFYISMDDWKWHTTVKVRPLITSGLCDASTMQWIGFWQKENKLPVDGTLDGAQFLLLYYELLSSSAQPDRDLVLSVLEAGVDLTARNGYGRTVLHFVLDPQIIQVLLDAGADPKARANNGATPLHHPHISAQAMQALLDAGADSNARNGYGRAPLHRAAMGSFLSLQGVRTLLDAGADPNARDHSGRTPLHYADGPQIVSMLIDAGADPNARDQYGTTPLFRSEISLMVSFQDEQAAQVAQALLDAGADINALDQYGETPLDVARVARRAGDLKVFETKLLDAGADPNTREKNGWTPTLGFARAQNILEDLFGAGVRIDPDPPASSKTSEHRLVRFLCQAAQEQGSSARFRDRALIFEQLTFGKLSSDPLIAQVPRRIKSDPPTAEFRMSVLSPASLVSGTWNGDRSNVQVIHGIGTVEYNFFDKIPTFVFETASDRGELGFEFDLTPFRHKALEGGDLVVMEHLRYNNWFVCDESRWAVVKDRGHYRCDEPIFVNAKGQSQVPGGDQAAADHAAVEAGLGLTAGGKVLVQTGLAAMNYEVGPADGIFGRKTRGAIGAWQEAQGLARTGYLTKEQAETLVGAGRRHACG